MSTKNRFLFKFYYFGSKKFYGSQRQLNLPTVEDVIINIFKRRKYIKNEKDSGFEFASRTDRFVSARGATFSVVIKKSPILMEINAELPHEMGLWAFTQVPITFSSRFSALERHYKYIYPLESDNSQSNLIKNVELMKKACKALEGLHDFRNFAKRDNFVIKTERTLALASIELINNYLLFNFKSKSFLRQQIRRMVAKVIEVGKKKITLQQFLKLFNPSKNISYQPANPVGLILWDINYEQNIKFIIDSRSQERMKRFFQTKERKYLRKELLFRTLQHNDIR